MQINKLDLSIGQIYEPTQMKKDREAITTILTNPQEAKLTDMSYRLNAGSHRIQSNFTVTDSKGTEQAIVLSWNFEAFDNKYGKIQAAIIHPNGVSGASIEMSIDKLPEIIKSQIQTKLAEKNPTYSCREAANNVAPEIKRMKRALATVA